ncbi:hypothetical protein MKJ04_16480 [Pontibacter sp. E15-1]|uniref:hypothetical protein n=1 Tax=Pontibacter sp. E15-1 TaxID=2919918 RepID=UPI001F4F65AC|nr:hypothetical protein [Pontibacter sp. E15-1]MCJ8166443.1 hypothetical protein [Pontibacter sp. E15-1]
MITIILALGLLILAGLVVKYVLIPKPIDTRSLVDSKIYYTSTSREWWSRKRGKYNLALVAAGISAFLAYAILGGLLIAPYDYNFEITLFTIFFQGIGYLFMMLIANLFYNLGYIVDKNFNKDNSQSYRQSLFNLGLWFSVGIPFLVPILIIVEYFVRFA